ncbi:hypothetical protein DMUE_3198 [Dictyocoela muelleri]|nr:hypothetical protein DMUE_3198 [Dictyocoela muelleri]
MDHKKEEILININTNIEKNIENLITIFEILKKPDQNLENELNDLLISKLKMIKAVDSIFLIFKDLVQLKYLEFVKDDQKNEEFDFSGFYEKNLFEIINK